MMGDNERRYVQLLLAKVLDGITNYPGVLTAVQLAMADAISDGLTEWTDRKRAQFRATATNDDNHSKHVDHREES